MKYYDLFSTPVAKYENFISIDESKEIFKTLMKDTSSIPHDYILGDAKTNTSETAQTLKSYPALEQKIIDALEHYTDQVGLAPVRILNSWFNIQNKGSELSPHTHPLSAISGALYINAEENSSGLSFDNPVANIIDLCWWNQKSKSKYTIEKEIFDVAAGDLFLFPGYIKHGGVLNNSSNRMCIVFDACYQYFDTKEYNDKPRNVE